MKTLLTVFVSVTLVCFALAYKTRPATPTLVFRGVEAPIQIPDVPVLAVKQETEKIIRMLVTAYCLCEQCCGKWARVPGKRVTSIGDDANVFDGVAADPKLLPYRTKLDIPGIGIKEVDDTGGAMRKDAENGICHIDVRFPSHQEARRWGVQWLEIEVLRTAPTNEES